MQKSKPTSKSHQYAQSQIKPFILLRKCGLNRCLFEESCLLLRDICSSWGPPSLCRPQCEGSLLSNMCSKLLATVVSRGGSRLCRSTTQWASGKALLHHLCKNRKVVSDASSSSTASSTRFIRTLFKHLLLLRSDRTAISPYCAAGESESLTTEI